MNSLEKWVSDIHPPVPKRKRRRNDVLPSAEKARRRNRLSQQFIQWVSHLPCTQSVQSVSELAPLNLPWNWSTGDPNYFYWKLVDKKSAADAWLIFDIDGVQVIGWIFAFTFAGKGGPNGYAALLIQLEHSLKIVKLVLDRMPNMKDVASNHWFIFRRSLLPNRISLQLETLFSKITYPVPNETVPEQIFPQIISLSPQQWLWSSWWSTMSSKRRIRLLTLLVETIPCADVARIIASFFQLSVPPSTH